MELGTWELEPGIEDLSDVGATQDMLHVIGLVKIHHCAWSRVSQHIRRCGDLILGDSFGV